MKSLKKVAIGCGSLFLFLIIAGIGFYFFVRYIILIDDPKKVESIARSIFDYQLPNSEGIAAFDFRGYKQATIESKSYPALKSSPALMHFEESQLPPI